ncbi:MAG TPA: NAD(P)-binding domain-containing protein [Candidatus Eisenbacteria bacterium]|nr:NAD(P)-binding domain-containing protein [Candidatus Eisenbacteria bacterium]
MPSRNSLAIIGAGPVGLEAAAAALDRGFDVHIFERGEVGAHLIAWGHVRMFTPWRMNVGSNSARMLESTGWKRPDGEACPTGAELARNYLEPLAKHPELASRIHAHTQVVHISRRGLLKADSSGPARREHPFRMLVRDVGGRESYLHAYAVIDASGVYGQPNWAGDGGIPARRELYLAPQMSYRIDDVLDLQRPRYAGKRTLLIGAGASAATTACDLARLAAEAPGTSVAWVTRRAAEALYPQEADDPLAARRELRARARALAEGGDPNVTHIGEAMVEEFEFNSATHRYRVILRVGDQARREEADQVIVNTGFGPDDSLYRELHVHECYTSRAPFRLAAALSEAGAGDCLTTPAFGADLLANPEPDFYILGHKSYGRNPHFLLQTGYQQCASVIEKLASDLAVTPVA